MDCLRAAQIIPTTTQTVRIPTTMPIVITMSCSYVRSRREDRAGDSLAP